MSRALQIRRRLTIDSSADKCGQTNVGYYKLSRFWVMINTSLYYNDEILNFVLNFDV